jgi:hypothetical protein
VFGNIFNNNGFAPDSDFHSGVHLRYAGDGTIKTEFHALTGNICNSNSGNGIHAQDGTNYCSFFGNQCNENVLGICIQHEPPPAPDYPPENNCTVGNVAVNNTDPGVGDVDISVSEYNKQIVANNIGNLNL